MKTIKYDCPICDQVHDVQIIISTIKRTYKGIDITYEEVLYLCKRYDEYFAPSKVLNQNLLNMKNAYRETLEFKTK